MLYSRILRARYWPALVALRVEYQNKGSWLATVHADLEWFASVSPKLVELRGSPLSAWTAMLVNDGPSVRELLGEIAVLQTQVAVQAARDAVADPGGLAASAQHALFGKFQCNACQLVFHEYQPYAAHMANAHGTKRMARKYAREGNQCTTCMQIFSNRARLVDHLAEKNPVCMMTAAWHLQPLTAEEAQLLDDAAAPVEAATRKGGQRYSHSHRGTQQAYGPLQQLYVPADSSRQSRTLTLRIAIRDAISWDTIAYGQAPLGRVCDTVAEAVADLCLTCDASLEAPIVESVEVQASTCNDIAACEDDERPLGELWPMFF